MRANEFTRQWITDNSVKILESYSDAITIRQLYYRLVTLGMTNDLSHYKKVVNAMIDARWKGIIDFGTFIDRDRSMYGETAAAPVKLQSKIEEGKEQVKAWMEAYSLNRWENQFEYFEVWIEKKALQGVFEQPCSRYNIGLAPCKGYPSLTFLHEAAGRFKNAMERDQLPFILYFGDYDPSGMDIPRAIEDNLNLMGIPIEVRRIALTQDQITRMKLPSVPAKLTDTRTKNWEGIGVVELDAVEPNTLVEMVESAIKDHFDSDLYSELKKREASERERYQITLKRFVSGL
jgi:hypothetical protein